MLAVISRGQSAGHITLVIFQGRIYEYYQVLFTYYSIWHNNNIAVMATFNSRCIDLLVQYVGIPERCMYNVIHVVVFANLVYIVSQSV